MTFRRVDELRRATQRGLLRRLSRDGSNGSGGWCLGPESNRYGVAPEGFSYSLQFSLPSDGALVWSLDFLFVVSRAVAEVRQGPSSLYTFLGNPGLARDCRHASDEASVRLVPRI